MRPVIALSDLHGQVMSFPLLADVRGRYPEAPVVLGGDYQDSYHHHTGLEVAETIYRMQRDEPGRIFALQGNHDAALVESMRGQNTYWLDAEGEDLILQCVAKDALPPASMAEALELVRQRYGKMLVWMAGLPLHLRIGRLIFVHAGFDLTLADPVALTPRQDQYWLREEYWYGPKSPIWAHNPLDASIVSGHTPTSLITGVYDGVAALATRRNRVASPHGILTVQYNGEYPRFFIDGGLHSGPAGRLPNIAVLDADTGGLIEAIEDAES
ncbi:metallophosphoesterase [Lacticaseibacillus suihuaensis]